MSWLSRYLKQQSMKPVGPASSRKPKLLLHVGPHKTGSTAIQQFCERNRDRLAQAGFWYPRVGIVGGQHLVLPGCYFSDHSCIPKSLLGGSPEQIVAAIGAETPPGLVPLLSSEVFWELLRRQPEAFESALAVLGQWYRVHIVTVERPDDERVWSGIKHDTRLGFACDPAELFGIALKNHRYTLGKLEQLGYPLIRVPYDETDCVSQFLESLSSQLGPWQAFKRLKLNAILRESRATAANLRENVAPREPWLVAFTFEFSRRLRTETSTSGTYDDRIATFVNEVRNLGVVLDPIRRLPDEDAMFQRVKRASGSPGCLLTPAELRAWESICEHPAVKFAARKAGCSDELRAVSRTTNHRQRVAA
jgi:hypothetical protein